MDVCTSGVGMSAAVGEQNDAAIASDDDIQWLIVSKRDAKTRLLPRRMLFIGREECDIVLQSTTVDKRHAVLFFNNYNHHFHIKDLNTSYGTYVNDKRIADQCYVRLQHSDRLRFGFGPDLFIIEKISSLPLISDPSNEASLATNDDSNSFANNSSQTLNNFANDLNKQKINNYNNNKTNKQMNSLQNDIYNSLEEKVSPVNGQSSERKAVDRLRTEISGFKQKLTKNGENNSNSSLSTVDSLDELNSTKRIENDCVLSNNLEISENEKPVKEMKNKINKNNNCLSETTTPVATDAAPPVPNSGAGDQTSGSATAFIISFDDTSNRKAMSIKDSIRQFAPPKPDSIEKPRPQKAVNNNSSDLSRCDNAFGTHRSPTPGPRRKTIAKSATNRTNACPQTETNGHLSDSATYLINRMLSQTPARGPTHSSDMKPNISDSPSKSTQSPKKCSPNSGEKDSGVSDDNKSESGTYTVEADQKDEELEDARKRIDKIFGVFGENTALALTSSPDSSLSSPTLLLSIDEKLSKAYKTLSSNTFDRNMNSKKPFLESSDTNTNSTQQIVANNSTFTRTKRRAPTVEEMLHQFEPKVENKSAKDLSQKYSNVLSHNSSQKNDLSSVMNNKSRAPVSQSAPSTPRSPLLSRKIIELQSKANNRRKNSCHSDLDYYESCNSDDSTDLSHKSSNSTASKDGGSTSCASVGSKMRFNRAFALRRARLGIETPGIDLDLNRSRNKTTNTTTNGRPSLGGQRPAGSAFSRSDGGRFSLRVPKKESIDSSKKRQNVSINRISSQETINKKGLQRKGSDPSNGAPQAGRSGLSQAPRSTYSDSDRHSFNNRWNQLSQRLRPTPTQTTNNSTNSAKSERNGLQKSSSFADSALNGSTGTNSALQMASKRLSASRGQPTAQLDKALKAKNRIDMNDNNMTLSSTEPSHKPPISTMQQKNRSVLELTALDGLVVSAVNQLSQKLRTNMRSLLESQRLKHEMASEARVMIDEILPQMSTPDRRPNDNSLSLSRDLSNALKNLKKVEQSLEVISTLLEPSSTVSTASPSPSRKLNDFFVVDV